MPQCGQYLIWGAPGLFQKTSEGIKKPEEKEPPGKFPRQGPDEFLDRAEAGG
jgi:hypothetical protein